MKLIRLYRITKGEQPPHISGPIHVNPERVTAVFQGKMFPEDEPFTIVATVGGNLYVRESVAQVLKLLSPPRRKK